MRLSFSTPSFAALAGLFVATMAANAQLTVTEPSGDHWCELRRSDGGDETRSGGECVEGMMIRGQIERWRDL